MIEFYHGEIQFNGGIKEMKESNSKTGNDIRKIDEGLVDDLTRRMYKIIADYARDGRFADIDTFLDFFPIKDFEGSEDGARFIIGALIITAGMKEKLKNREEFYNKAEMALLAIMDEEEVKEILEGL
jgi:hypothetical protein